MYHLTYCNNSAIICLIMKLVPTIGEVISTPSESSLNEQVEKYGIEGELDGKFVRIGRLPIFVPLIDLKVPVRGGITAPSYEVKRPDHSDIVKAALRDPEDAFCADFIAERDRVVADNNEHKLVKAIFKDKTDSNNLPVWTKLIYARDAVVDAGTYVYDFENKTLNVFDDSMVWGAANNAGRVATRELIQSGVGSNITVSSAP